ncbi:hypothetical protein ABIC83_004524 [Roseateles asaccharophilus]
MMMFRTLAAGLALACSSLAAAPIGGPHTDPQGRTAVLVGQTRDGIHHYMLDSRMPLPWGLTMYVAPTLDSGGFTLADGSRSKTASWYAEGFGPQDLAFITGTPQLQGSAIAVGFWMANQLDVDLATGSNRSGSNEGNRLWANVQRMIGDLKATGRPVLLRIGYEAEGPWNGYWPSAYKTVWSKMRAEIRAQKADNIATVWQLAVLCPSHDAWNAGITPGRLIAAKPLALDGKARGTVQNVDMNNVGAVLDAWYPGDDADWTGVSVFDPQDCHDGYGTLQTVVDHLKKKGKPILVAEAAARGFDYDVATGLYAYRQTGKPVREKLAPEQVWREWYQPFLAFVRANRDSIRAVAMISDDWQRYTHWQCRVDAQGKKLAGCNEGNWGDTRLDVNPRLRALWRAELSADGKYLADKPAAQP